MELSSLSKKNNSYFLTSTLKVNMHPPQIFLSSFALSFDRSTKIDAKRLKVFEPLGVIAREEFLLDCRIVT